jgi:acetylornithine/N-succinyldiaminopimelate aminotransferase
MTVSALLPVYSRCSLEFSRGEGAYLYTADGTRYLDFAAGIAVNALGHSHPHLVAELGDQVKKLWHVSNLYQIEGLERLAQRIAEATFADYSFFCNSGAEAVECGIKMVRKYHDTDGNPDKYRIITFEGSFHGRTLATISAAKKDKLTAGFEPLVEGFDQVKFGDLEAVKKAIRPDTGAILLEPVLGEGGVLPASAEFLQGLRKLCDEHRILLFLDEIQCGMGRTGKLFAHEWAGITPDIMAVAKGIGGGFPMGACLATKEAAKGMTVGTHGSTYANGPLAVRVGNAVLDVVLKAGFLKHVNSISAYLHAELEKLRSRQPKAILEVRGKGLMLGIKVSIEPREFVEKLRTKKLLTVAAADNVVRILPPLIIEKAHVDEAIRAIEELCKEF